MSVLLWQKQVQTNMPTKRVRLPEDRDYECFVPVPDVWSTNGSTKPVTLHVVFRPSYTRDDRDLNVWYQYIHIIDMYKDDEDLVVRAELSNETIKHIEDACEASLPPK